MVKPEPPSLPRFLCPDEVATVLTVSRSYVYKLVQKGALRSHRIGSKGGPIRVSDGDLIEFISRCRSRNVQETPKPAAQRRKLKYLRL